METVLIQKEKKKEQILTELDNNQELAELIRSFNGKYTQERGALTKGKPEENRRCVMGALLTEFGWDAKFPWDPSGTTNWSNTFNKMISKFPQLTFDSVGGYWNFLADENNSGKNWNELADFVERGFKD